MLTSRSLPALFLLAAFSCIFSGCADDEASQQPLNFIRAGGETFKMVSGQVVVQEEISMFSGRRISLWTEGIILNKTENFTYLSGTGAVIYISLFSENDLYFNEGTYFWFKPGKHYTNAIASAEIRMYDGTSYGGALYAQGGTVQVWRKGEEYRLKLDLDLLTNMKIEGTYEGILLE